MKKQIKKKEKRQWAGPAPPLGVCGAFYASTWLAYNVSWLLQPLFVQKKKCASNDPAQIMQPGPCWIIILERKEKN
jgi:hypothetical protein